MKMNIENFKIIGLFGKKDVSLTFKNKVQIYVGENGLGKTTVLNLLYYLLSCKFEEMLKTNFSSVSIKLNSKTYEFTKTQIQGYVESNKPSYRRTPLYRHFQQNLKHEDLVELKKIIDKPHIERIDKIIKNLFTKASEYLNSKRRHFSKMTHDALKYMINGWEDLIRYREDGNYDRDNLAAERAIRPFTVHRKNAVSFGSEDGVKEACVYFTLCETCKQCGINFKEHITHVVKEIMNGNTNYETLVPWAIKLA